MKKTGRILLIVLAVLLAAVFLVTGYALVFHMDLVKTVYKGLTMSPEQLETMQVQNRNQEQQAVKDAGLESITIDKETEQKILNGEVSQEDIANMLLGQNKEEQNKEDPKEQEELPVMSEKPTDKTATQSKEPENKESQIPPDKFENKDESEQNKQVAELVARMYVLKAQYSSEVEGIVESMKKEYAALDESQRTTSAKTSIVSKYLNTISAMEAQCDAQVNSVVEQLKQVLKDTGQDTTLADSILQAYKNEKEITKSYYISKYS